MPNPNLSELKLRASYGPNEAEEQDINIYETTSEDSDQTDHKWVENVPWAGRYVELAHYASVKQIVIQCDCDFDGITFHADATTAAVVPDYVGAGEHISINHPDVTAGLMLYSESVDELTNWHLAIIGSLA